MSRTNALRRRYSSGEWLFPLDRSRSGQWECKPRYGDRFTSCSSSSDIRAEAVDVDTTVETVLLIPSLLTRSRYSRSTPRLTKTDLPVCLRHNGSGAKSRGRHPQLPSVESASLSCGHRAKRTWRFIRSVLGKSEPRPTTLTSVLEHVEKDKQQEE
jgi:hypothetical protein